VKSYPEKVATGFAHRTQIVNQYYENCLY